VINLRQNRRSSSVLRIEMAPFLDVIFTLLLFFGVSSTLISTQKAIGIQLPHSNTATVKDNGMLIQIMPDGGIQLDGLPVPLTGLSGMIQDRLTQKPDEPVVLQADEGTPYQVIVSVIDAIRSGGSQQLLLDTQRKPNAPTRR